MIIGYMDKSERNIGTEAQRLEIEQYAAGAGMTVDAYCSYAGIEDFVQTIETPNHTVIFANIVGLGGTLAQIKENIALLTGKKLKIISIKENLRFEAGEETEWLLRGLELSINLRNSLVSVVTRKALEAKRAQGFKLGRDFGHKNKRYIWEGKEAEIDRLLRSGVSRAKTAEKVGMSVMSLYNFLKMRQSEIMLAGGANG